MRSSAAIEPMPRKPPNSPCLGWCPFLSLHRLTPRARRRIPDPPDGRTATVSSGRQRKVRAPREYGAGQPPAGATPGKVPQKTNRPRKDFAVPAGKGETVRQERTARLATGAQGKPHREQDRIGTAAAARLQGHSRLAVRVGRVRRAARRVPEEWSSRMQVRTEPGLQAVWRRSCLLARPDRFDCLRSAAPPIQANHE
jgi:hypothetical protein